MAARRTRLPRARRACIRAQMPPPRASTVRRPTREWPARWTTYATGSEAVFRAAAPAHAARTRKRLVSWAWCRAPPEPAPTGSTLPWALRAVAGRSAMRWACVCRAVPARRARPTQRHASKASPRAAQGPRPVSMARTTPRRGRAVATTWCATAVAGASLHRGVELHDQPEPMQAGGNCLWDGYLGLLGRYDQPRRGSGLWHQPGVQWKRRVRGLCG